MFKLIIKINIDWNQEEADRMWVGNRNAANLQVIRNPNNGEMEDGRALLGSITLHRIWESSGYCGQRYIWN